MVTLDLKSLKINAWVETKEENMVNNEENSESISAGVSLDDFNNISNSDSSSIFNELESSDVIEEVSTLEPVLAEPEIIEPVQVAENTSLLSENSINTEDVEEIMSTENNEVKKEEIIAPRISISQLKKDQEDEDEIIKQEEENKELENIKTQNIEVIEENKEFFPSLNVMEDFEIEEESIIENKEEKIEEIPTIEDTIENNFLVKEEVEQKNEELVNIDNAEISSEIISDNSEVKPSNENMPELEKDTIKDSIVLESETKTQESSSPQTTSVWQIKTELSSTRKFAWISNFKKKTIIASIAVLSLGIIGFIANWLISWDDIKSSVIDNQNVKQLPTNNNTNNNQEIPSNTTVPTNNNTNIMTWSNIQEIDVNKTEEGLDYKIIKNTKKNIKKNKTPQIITPNLDNSWAIIQSGSEVMTNNSWDIIQ